jgi:hypothetical protein
LAEYHYRTKGPSVLEELLDAPPPTRKQRWSWWPAAGLIVLAAVAYPLVLAAAAAVGAVVERWEPERLPSEQATEEFHQVQPGFEEVARRLVAEPGRTYESRLQIGSFRISHAYDTTADEVFFHEIPAGGTRLGWNPGWAYSPHGIPRGFDESTMTHVGGAWYRFTDVVVDS